MDNPQYASPVRLLNPRAQTSPVVYGDDSALFVEFYDEDVHNELKSSQQGRAIFEKVVYCKIIFPGDRSKSYIEKVRMHDDANNPSHPHRFPRQWAAYEAQHEQVPDGMPLEQWPPMTKQRVKELKTLHIHTVEQVAALSDQTGPIIGLDWRKMRDMAVATLQPAAASVEISRLGKENEELKAKLDAMNAQVMSINQRLAPDTTEGPKPRAQRKTKQEVVNPFDTEKSNGI